MTESSKIKLAVSEKNVVADGMEFGSSGAYERCHGKVNFAVDPNDHEISQIIDLSRADCNNEGLVEFSSDFCLLKPLDLARGNRRLLYDVVNRGNKRVLVDFNEAMEGENNCFANDLSRQESLGNGFLLRQGYTIVWSAWQGDILSGDNRMIMDLPRAREVTGKLRTELITEESDVYFLPLSGNPWTRSYETVSLDTRRATLTCREHESDQRVPLSPHAWQFGRLDDGGNILSSAGHCYVRDGFRPGWLYELIYTSFEPPVMGLGFIGVQRLVTFLMSGEDDNSGNQNPLRESEARLEKAYAYGISQSARFLREFVYRGYNASPDGSKIFDGLMAHVAGAGRVTLNYRFAQPGRFPRQHADHLYPSDQFPFAYHVINDPLSGKTDGILKRPDSDPLIIHSQSSAEYWERRGSLVHTDPIGNDLPPHDGARTYLFSSAPHVPCPDASQVTEPQAYPKNRLNTSPLLRALLIALDKWVSEGMEPPPDNVPRTDQGTAVTAERAGELFPEISGVRFPGSHNRLFVQDFGPGYGQGVLDREPPEENRQKEYAVLVPKTDADGLEIAGLRTPDVTIPLATSTGWNMRPPGCGGDDLSGVLGGCFPFAATEQERKDNGDPRPSIEFRYKNHGEYIQSVSRAVQVLVKQRILLDDDADKFVMKAEKTGSDNEFAT